MFENIPQCLSISLASALCGLSRKTFRARFIRTGLVKLSWDHLWKPAWTGRGFLYRHEVEKAVGRKFTMHDYGTAERRLERARCYQRDYSRRKAGGR